MADARRRRVFEHPGRVAVMFVAFLLVLSLGAFLLNSADTTPGAGGRPQLPAAIESISPERGELTGLVDSIVVDLQDNLTGNLVVDGRQIPEDQLERTEQLGIIEFRPGPGKEIPHLLTGENTVVVTYWPRIEDEPASPPSFSWRFRAAA
jgi:hypothetical protein